MSQIHYIDSQYKIDGVSTTDFTHAVQIPRSHNRMSLYAITIPKSYYLINQPLNTFTLTDQSNMTVYTITIPIGNYSINEMINMLNTLLSNPQTHIVVSFNARIGKMTWTTGSNRHYSSSFNTKLRKIFGFNENPEFIHSNPPYTGANICNFQPLNTISVICDAVNSQPFGETSSLLHQVYVNLQSDFSYIFYENTHPTDTGKRLILDTSSNELNYYKVRIQLLDEDELPLSVNGLDIDLQLYTYYEPSSPPDIMLYNMIRDYISYRTKMDERKSIENN